MSLSLGSTSLGFGWLALYSCNDREDVNSGKHSISGFVSTTLTFHQQRAMYTATSKVCTVFTIAALFLLLVGCSVAAIVCPPGYCGRVRCKQVDEATCDGIVKQNATFCQCCPACIKLLGENESCISLLLVGGGPPKVQCSEGLYCDRNTAKCIPI
uniref:Putative secreted protein n=1 Tax=Rhipicephalus microplus TaxID=6941 RepID=A0A6M2D3H0_RHIMP